MIPFRRRAGITEDRLQRAGADLTAMATQVDSLRQQLHRAEDRIRLADAARNAADASAKETRLHTAQLTDEVTALRRLLEVEKSKRGTDRRCAVCQDPMPWGTAHYCHRMSEYREEAAA